MPEPHSPAMATAARHFGIDGSDLVVGGVPVREIAEAVGTPLYIYDAEGMRTACRRLAGALGGHADIHYSVKANPSPAVIALFASQGCGMEVASLGEYGRARGAGVAPGRILFAGPGKRPAELEEVIGDGIGEIHVESMEEIGRIEGIGTRLGRKVKVAIRVNPVPKVQAGAMRMGGKPTPFGFPEEELGEVVEAIEAASTMHLVGVHVYGGTQILDAGLLVAQWHHAVEVAAAVASMTGWPLETIDLGGGLGIPYFENEPELDLSVVAAAMPELAGKLRGDPLLAQARLIVEPGRYLTGPAGLYVMEINAVKQSRGARFLITDGGMHHHLAASGNLGQIIKRNYPIVAPAHIDAADLAPAMVVGPLCTPLDTLARDALLPRHLKAGDLVAVLQSGAYGLTASPVGFLSHPLPAEIMVDDGAFRRL